MSCCPPAPPIKVAAAGDAPTGIQDNQPLRGESAECFMATANNPTGKHDDATGNVLNKIETPTIPLDAAGRAKVQFKMQSFPAGAEGLRTPNLWQIKDDDGSTPAWVTSATFNSATGALDVLFDESYYGKTIRVTVAALDGPGNAPVEIDNRGYVFSPAKSTASDSIQFLHPLPGAVVTSRFDLQRLHPVKNIIKPHFGCDFALPGRKIGDVLAAADGEVIFTGFEAGGAGNYVKIKHLNTSGKHLCTTVYMHLAQIYVAVNQKVPAGQKIGLEGNTGIGTGAHLHFECRLPNDTRIDPLPLIRGSLEVATTTNDDNTAGTTETRSSNAVLTPANVDAKQSGCSPYGAEYPAPTTAAGTPPPAPSSGDAFELAWDLTMQTETIGWPGTPPTNAQVIAGDVSTKQLRQWCGYIDHPADPGGLTKFGIAQKFNKSIVVETADYQTARNAGYASFWNGKKPGQTADAGKPKLGIAMFNLGFVCGLGGLNTIITRANLGSLDELASIDALCNQAKAYFEEKIQETPSKSVFRNGWFARVEKVRTFAKAANVT